MTGVPFVEFSSPVVWGPFHVLSFQLTALNWHKLKKKIATSNVDKRFLGFLKARPHLKLLFRKLTDFTPVCFTPGSVAGGVIPVKRLPGCHIGFWQRRDWERAKKRRRGGERTFCKGKVFLLQNLPRSLPFCHDSTKTVSYAGYAPEFSDVNKLGNIIIYLHWNRNRTFAAKGHVTWIAEIERAGKK